MAKAYQLPSGQWRCQPFAGGKRGNIIADSKLEAEYLAEKWKEETLIEEKKLPFQRAAENYIAARGAVYSPKTIRECKGMLRRFPDDITKTDVHNINRQSVQWWVNDMAATLSPKTVKNYFGFFAAVVHDYHPEKVLNIRLPQQRKKEIYVPSTEEVKHLLDIYSSRNRNMFIATLMASNMGLRRSEICALPNEPEKFKQRIIHVSQARVKNDSNGYTIKTTKTYSSQRTLTAPRHVAESLLTIPREQEYIVAIDPDSITDEFGDAVRREFDHIFRFHDLRHYFTSILLAENIPERYIMEMLGHSSPNMIRKVYGHIMEEKDSRIKNLAAEAFNPFSLT